MVKHASTAKVVDGSLVLSLPDAVTPVVMRLSLEEAKSAAFTVLEKKDQHVLTVQLSEKDSREIAPYDEKEKAVKALMAASQALEKGSPVAPGAANQNTGNAGASLMSFGKWVVALGVLFVLVWVVSSMSNSLPRAPLPASLQNNENTVAAQQGSDRTPFENPREVTGQAVSADDFLSR